MFSLNKIAVRRRIQKRPHSYYCCCIYLMHFHLLPQTVIMSVQFVKLEIRTKRHKIERNMKKENLQDRKRKLTISRQYVNEIQVTM